jgi:hypothetical protein
MTGPLLLWTAHDQHQPSTLQRNLARLPWLNSSSWGGPSGVNRFVFFDERNGQEVARGDGDPCGNSPDGRLFIMQDREHKYLLWDIPPGKPWYWHLAFGGLIVFPVSLFAWRQTRKRIAHPRSLDA